MLRDAEPVFRSLRFALVNLLFGIGVALIARSDRIRADAFLRGAGRSTWSGYSRRGVPGRVDTSSGAPGVGCGNGGQPRKLAGVAVLR